MKRITIILLAACLQALAGQMLLADPVSEKTAYEIASRILSAQKGRKGPASVDLVWNGGSDKEQPAMYVFTSKGGGFVIISGDDNTVPVLAISDNGTFEVEDMPENVQWWMERMQSQVRSAQTVAQSPKVRRQWAKLMGTKADDWSLDAALVTEIEGHPTPEWDQGNADVDRVVDGQQLPGMFGQNIFNKFCPTQSGKLTVTGCVATAIGEVLTTLSGLYPEEMPSRGTGSVGGYSVPNGYVRPSQYTLGSYDYDWEGLRTLTDKVAIKTALEQGKTALLNNLGHLLADCGAIMQAQYSVDGTGAVTENTPSYMADHFYMSKKARVEKADRYSSAQWIRMLKAELLKHPVLYSGRTTDGQHGHAFVFDGFGRFGENEDVVFHVNFGWRGICNGYYRYTYLKTDEGGETGQDEIWENDCDAIFDFFPDKSQVTSSGPYLKMYRTTGTNPYTGISATSSTTPGSSFRLRIGAIKNTGRQSFSGYIVACLKKKDGTLIKIGQSQQQASISTSSNSYYGGSSWTASGNASSGGYWNQDNVVSCTIPANTKIDFGDRIVVCYSSGSNSTNYVEIPYDDDGEIIGEIPLETPAAFIKRQSTYHVGDYFPFALEYYGDFYAGTTWTITDPDGLKVTKPQSYQSYCLRKTGRYKIDAAIAPSIGADVVEHVVMVIEVQ